MQKNKLQKTDSDSYKRHPMWYGDICKMFLQMSAGFPQFLKPQAYLNCGFPLFDCLHPKLDFPQKASGVDLASS
jgi:hypothetical protein